MKKFSLALILPLFQFCFSACGLMRAPSLNLLNSEADYKGEKRLQNAMSDLEQPLLVPNRTSPKVTDIWIHPHEMPSGDYFRGGWIRTIVTDSRWEMGTPKALSSSTTSKKANP